jgi:putative ABC transport system ATP-binding protein
VLELRGVVKHYPSGGGEVVRAIDGVSLRVERGKLLALYGPSGSGKTTLLQIVAALLQPDRGEVLVRGRDISRLPAREAARYRLTEVGFVRQSLDLLPGVTALDNAALKLLNTRVGVRVAHREVTPLLQRLGLEERLRSRADQLSMGERQRVMIARALSTRPTLLLADEPTGSLDTQRSRDVLELLVEVCREQDVAVLLVTHDPQAAGVADTVQTLRDGRLVGREQDADPRLAPSGGR